jgi:hypothetical protein
MVASFITMSMTMPASRELVIKLGTLVSWTQRQNFELYRQKVEPINPFVGTAFKHNRITSMLRADLGGFGAACQQLQLEARKLDRRAHVGMLPVVAYALGVGAWWLLK